MGIKEDTGGGCSVCGGLPAVNVEGTYWLCGPCVFEKSERTDGLLDGLIEEARSLVDILNAYDGSGIPESDARDAFAFLRKLITKVERER